MNDDKAPRHRVRIYYECDEPHDERPATTYVVEVPMHQPWKGGRPWNLVLRDTVYEAADLLLESLARDMRAKP